MATGSSLSDFAKDLIGSFEYQESFKQRALKGELPAQLEMKLWDMVLAGEKNDDEVTHEVEQMSDSDLLTLVAQMQRALLHRQELRN